MGPMAFPAERREEARRGELVRWWMSSLLRLSEVQFIREEWSGVNTGREEIAFSIDLQPGVRKRMENDMRVSAHRGDEYGSN